MDTAVEVGIYGKMPSHGDFLRRRLDDEFVHAWDQWLQACIAESRTILGESWLQFYLTSPVWRFVCAAGACGSQALAGLLLPSVDKVGRYFPLTIAWALPAHLNILSAASQCNPWFAAVEQLAVDALAQDRPDFEEFDRQLRALDHLIPGPAAITAVRLRAPDSWFDSMQVQPLRLPLPSAGEMSVLLQELLVSQLDRAVNPVTLWWTDGSSAIEPGCLMTAGLPAHASFAAMLDGQWAASSWLRIDGDITSGNSTAEHAVSPQLPLTYSSIGETHPGLVRTSNQDALLMRPEIGLWMVADGLGGYGNGEVASRMTCDSLAQLLPQPTLDHMIDAVRFRLSEVNAHLRRAALRRTAPVKSASTVVVLLTRCSRFAVLWAGDSRAYWLHAAKLEQLTLDHADGARMASEVSQAPFANGAVTRAVGGEDELFLDVVRGELQGGDRVLLCSDGLTRVVADGKIAELLGFHDLAVGVAGLLQHTLSAGAPDNVTLVAVNAE